MYLKSKKMKSHVLCSLKYASALSKLHRILLDYSLLKKSHNSKVRFEKFSYSTALFAKEFPKRNDVHISAQVLDMGPGFNS